MGALSTRQLQKLTQKLSPQQIQMIKLLELPTIQLEQRIKQEIEENPVLEETLEVSDGESSETTTRLNIDEYVKNENIPSYKININNYSKDDKHGVIPLSDGLSYTEHLEEQLSYKELNSKERLIGKYLIGSLDSDGYLRRELINISDDIAFAMSIDTSEEEIENILSVVHTFEPHGTGARSLQEALLLQLKFHPQSDDVKLATKVLKEFFALFAKRHFDKIMSRMNLDNETFRNVVNIITGLSPKPSNLYTDTAQNEPTIQITPDFVIDYTAGELELSLFKCNMPEIKISKSYIEILKTISNGNIRSKKNTSEKSAEQFIKQKIDSARWFLSAIKQRNATLLLTMHTIMDFQHEYFIKGDETVLRPMILKDIADITGLDVSTISRVVNSKYVHTHFGMYSLKYFFSEAMQTSSGEEVSSREIKSILYECVKNEDKNKPLTDEALMVILQDKEYKIARRTVAKYREMLNIPVARLRKEI